jgi:hypothetical protein
VEKENAAREKGKLKMERTTEVKQMPTPQESKRLDELRESIYRAQDKAVGVTFEPKRNKWKAQICWPGENRMHLGYFATSEEAAAAYKAARKVKEVLARRKS